MNRLIMRCSMLAMAGAVMLLTSQASANTSTLFSAEDTTIMAVDYAPNNANTNFSGEQTVSVYSNSNNVQRTLLKFDLSGIPSGATINSATLKLYSYLLGATGGSNPQHIKMDVFRVTKDWMRNQATWNRRLTGTPWTTVGGDYVGTTQTYDTSPYARATDNPLADDVAVSWTITSLVNEWRQGTYANQGLVVRSYYMGGLDDQSNHLLFRSSNYAVAAVRPQLVVDYTMPGPDIRVQESGTTLFDGNSTPVNFQYSPVGTAVTKTFTITNTGDTDLTLGALGTDGADAADFAVAAPANGTVISGGSTTFTVTFTPSTGGAKSAALHIACNVTGTTNPFDINLSGTGLSFTTDTDGDGMNDAAEYLLAPLGFNWQVKQEALVVTYYAGAKSAGLYTTAEVHALHVGKPLLAKDPLTGHFNLTVGISKSIDLSQFTPFPMTPSQATINTSGNLEFRFDSAENAAFFRVEAK
jgi:hypothetical protein